MVNGLTATAAGFAAGLSGCALALVRRTELVFDSTGEDFFFRMILPWGTVVLAADLVVADFAFFAGLALTAGLGAGLTAGLGAGLTAGFFAGSGFFGGAAGFDGLAGLNKYGRAGPHPFPAPFCIYKHYGTKKTGRLCYHPALGCSARHVWVREARAETSPGKITLEIGSRPRSLAHWFHI